MHQKAQQLFSILVAITILVAASLFAAAQTPGNGLAIEAEDGAKNGLVTNLTSSLASDGQAVQFGSASSGSGFSTQGADIIGPDGQKFVPIGANVGVYIEPYSQYAFTSEGTYATGHVQDAIDWGWNMIRVNVLSSPNGEVTVQRTIDGVQAVIDEYTAEGIVVMPALHDLTGANATMAHAKYVYANQFWDGILAANKDNPYVWVNYINEPATESASSSSYWRDLADAQYARVRAHGDTNMFVMDYAGWTQNMSELANTSIGTDFLAGKTNAVLSWHNYGAAGTETQMSQYAQAIINKDIPLIIGEFGDYEFPSQHPESYPGSREHHRRGVAWTFDNFWTYGFGGLWWHATGAGEPGFTLRTNGVATWYADEPLSANGQRMLEIPNLKP